MSSLTMKSLFALAACVVLMLLPVVCVAEVLTNSAFEEIDEHGTAVGWVFAGSGIRAERGCGHNGSGGLIWESKNPSASQTACRQEIRLTPGVSYVFSCLVRTEGFKASEGGGVNICIEWYDKNGIWISGGYTHAYSEKDCDWTELKAATRAIPETARRIIIQVYVTPGCTGRVYVDNVVVRPLNRSIVPFVFSSAYRNEAVSGSVRFHAPFFLGGQYKRNQIFVKFGYWDKDGNKVVCEPSEVSEDGASLSIDVEMLKMGESDVICGIYKRDGELIGKAKCRFVRVEELTRRRVSVDKHHRCIVDGKPFFPLGMYCGNVTEQQLDTYTQGPFNVIMPYARPTLSELDAFDQRGIKAFVILRDELLGSSWARKHEVDTREKMDSYYREIINKYKSHPAMLGWYVNDEAPVTEVSERMILRDAIWRNDPDHPAWAVLDRTHDLCEFIPTFDVLGVDPYPIAQKPISYVAEFVREAKKVTYSDVPMWNVPQAFDWGWFRRDQREKERFPTEAEISNMCWQHIAMGANGLVSYCFHSLYRDADAKDFNDFWGRICRAHEDVKKVMPILLSNAPAPSLPSLTPGILTRTWREGRKVFVLAVNVEEKEMSSSLGFESIGDGVRLEGVILGAADCAIQSKSLVVRLAPKAYAMIELVWDAFSVKP